MKTKAVYVNDTLVGEAVTWAAVYKLLTGLINTERAARGLQLKLGMLRLQCLSGGYYVARNVEGVRSVQNNLFVK